MNIPIPSAEEKDESIKIILNESLKQRKGLSGTLRQLITALGVGNIFFGVGDCIFLSVASSLIFAGLLSAAVDFMGTALLILSPFIYGTLHLLTIWKEYQTGTYSLKAVCRYTIRQMTAIRMLFFSILGTLINTVLLLLWCSLNSNPALFFNLLGVSLMALFLYAVLVLGIQLLWGDRRSAVAAPILWAGWTLFMASALGHRLAAFLIDVPEIGLFPVLAVLIAVFIYEIKLYCLIPEGGNKNRAYS